MRFVGFPGYALVFDGMAYRRLLSIVFTRPITSGYRYLFGYLISSAFSITLGIGFPRDYLSYAMASRGCNSRQYFLYSATQTYGSYRERASVNFNYFYSTFYRLSNAFN